MVRRQQPLSPGTPAGPQADLPAARPAVRLPQSDTPNITQANAVVPIRKFGTTAGPAANPLAAEALAKRRAFIRALAQQAARELAARALAAHDD
jgi:hypothetical protein